MKTKLIFPFFFIICISFNTKAQSEMDKGYYWILEDFKNFDVLDDWVLEETSYLTYPNNVLLTTVHANVEIGYDCAYGQNALRIRGVEEGGSAKFTVQNAGKAIFRFTGKQKASDRGFIVYKNGIEVGRQEGLDRYDCIEYIDEEGSSGEVTYTITAADPTKKDPIVLYYIEVQKYGVNIPNKPDPEINYNAYWIYETFKTQEIEPDYNTQKNYSSYPNNIALRTDSANIELGEGCSGGYSNKILRIRGKYYEGGKVEFTVPNAESVAITVTGKSTYADRTVKIFRDNSLIKTFNNLDRNSCAEFSDDVHSNETVIYRIEGGNNTEKPVGIKSIYVKKYGYTNTNNVRTEPYKVYPNPANETVYFQSNNNKPIRKVNILDANGRTILSQENISEMNISYLKKGFYIVKLFAETGVFSQKLIKN
jgi:hypothetical protein